MWHAITYFSWQIIFCVSIVFAKQIVVYKHMHFPWGTHGGYLCPFLRIYIDTILASGLLAVKVKKSAFEIFADIMPLYGNANICF